MNKKSNIWDVVTTFRGLAVLSFAVLIVAAILKQFATDATPLMPPIVVTKIIPWMQNYGAYWDWVSLAIYLGLIAVSVIFARLIQSNMIFLIASFIAMPLIGVILMITGKVVSSLMVEPAFATVITDMPITYFMWTGPTPLILGIIYMVIVFIALYAGKNE